MGMDVIPIFHLLYVKGQETLRWACQQLNFVARSKDYLLGDHLQIKTHFSGRFILERSDHGIVSGRHVSARALNLGPSMGCTVKLNLTRPAQSLQPFLDGFVGTLAGRCASPAPRKLKRDFSHTVSSQYLIE